MKEKRAAAESFLLAIAEKPLDKEQIANESRLSLEEVEEIASLFLSSNLITLKNNRWATNVPVITDGEMNFLEKLETQKSFKKYYTEKQNILPAQASGVAPTFTENENKILEALGWKEKETLLVPVLDENTRKNLIPLIEKTGEGAADTVFQNFDIIMDAFQKSPYAKFLDGAGDYIQYCYHVLMYLTIESLIQKGFLPPIPAPFPEYFGAYVVYEKLK